MEDNHRPQHKVILKLTPTLVTALCDCVNDVSDHCLAKGLITEDTNAEMLVPAISSRNKARILLKAIRGVVEINSDCFDTFTDILEEVLPFGVRRKLITSLRDGCKSRNRMSSSTRQRPLFEHVLIRFTGPLATKKFLKLDRFFCNATHAGKAESIMFATKNILSMNISMDYKSICLLYRANCKALLQAQMDEAILDCDRAIKLAENLACENGSLIIGRALRMKTSILRSVGRLDEALKCVSEAKEKFFLAAPSSDTAALLYEDVRLKICIAMSNDEDLMLYISDVSDDYDRILKHSVCLESHDRSQLCIFLNSNAELFLRSAYIERELPDTAIAPTHSDLCRAEKILNSIPLDELPKKAYVYRGWCYRTRGDLCMWRKQYSKAIEWARKAQDQFTLGNLKHITNPQERIELYRQLQLQESQMKKNKRRFKLRQARRCHHRFRHFTYSRRWPKYYKYFSRHGC